MAKYILYHHRDCSDCAKQAAQTRKLDWFRRIGVSTEIPPTGALEKGEIVLISNDDKAYTRGFATRKICLNVPVYFLYGLLLFLPPLLKAASKGKAGCNGDVCDVNTS